LRHGRARHILRQNDFTLAYKQGSRARCAYYTVVVRENGGPHTRLGLSVGKAAYREAVDRNRARRVLREAFRLAQPDLPAGLDVVLIGIAGAGRLELGPVLEPLAGLVRKAARRLRERRAAEAATPTPTSASASGSASASASAPAPETAEADSARPTVQPVSKFARPPAASPPRAGEPA
jgi:ribonuclease P protein component